MEETAFDSKSKAAKDVDKKTKQEIKKRQKAEKAQIKLLLLGAGESGKTTVLKQMTLLHGGGFNDKYKAEMKPKICFNLIEGALSIIKAAAKLDMPIQDENTLASVDVILEKQKGILGNKVEMDQELADAILLFRKDAVVNEIIQQRSKFQLIDSWDEFVIRLEKFPAWGGPSWMPDVEDILLARVRTTGVVDQVFQIKGTEFRIIDVGGQRSERRKWMTLFGGVTGLIFVAALSEYNQVLFEHSGTNRLVESVELWKKYANKSDFQDSAILLFLNKFDLFQKKYFHDHVPIAYDGDFVKEKKGSIPKYEDEENEMCEKATQWFTNLYKFQLEKTRTRMLYVHVTTALDPSNMETVINATASHILQQNMKKSGLVSF
mmetsp:Transcript_11570/g.13293  ORF Transcript_11570/g.13293 Transcript_11570/m.13293 type:complete len:377 (+) Transcript_11570:473-1603(+)